MASSHTCTPPRQALARVAPLVRSSAVFLLPRWSETSVSAVSSSLKCRKYKDCSAVNMNIKLSGVFADTVDAMTATFAV